MIVDEKVIQYYRDVEIDYRLVWHLGDRRMMHYGFWREDTRRLRDALDNINDEMAVRVQLASGEKVLDAGCGVGGSAVYLAQRYGVKVIGITITPEQVVSASRYAQESGFGGHVTFENRDYLHTGFPDESFDVVWAIESVCYAENKEDFLNEAYRILKKGGRVIVADFFKTDKPMNSKEQRMYASVVNGWQVKDFARIKQFRSDMESVGFKNCRTENITHNIVPSSRRLYLLSWPAIVVTSLLESVGLRNRIQSANVWNAHYQYPALNRNLWKYYICYARK